MNLINCPHGAVVYDVGSSSIQCGFAGDAMPIISVPSSSLNVQKNSDNFIYFGDSWLKRNIPGSVLQVNKMIGDNGALEDPDLFNTFLDWTMQECLHIPQETTPPILINQPTHLTQINGKFNEWRQNICQCIFEFLDNEYLCLEHDSVLACFAHSNQTAVVVDCGWSCFRITPVMEGKPKIGSMQINRYGGYSFIKYLEKRLIDTNTPIRCATDYYSGASESQVEYCRRYVLNDMLVSNLNFLPVKPETHPYIYYMSPTEHVDVSQLMRDVYHLMWEREAGSSPIQDYLQLAITKCPADMHRILWNNIVTSGGISATPGFQAQLEKSATDPGRTNYNPKVIPPMDRITSGQFTVWAGGSILASLDNFPEFCITKAEYQENGETILNTKCL